MGRLRRKISYFLPHSLISFFHSQDQWMLFTPENELPLVPVFKLDQFLSHGVPPSAFPPQAPLKKLKFPSPLLIDLCPEKKRTSLKGTVSCSAVLWIRIRSDQKLLAGSEKIIPDPGSSGSEMSLK